jgi:LysM repeat protein
MNMLEIGSAAAAPSPARQNQSRGADAKSTPATPDTSPAQAWDAAVAKAKANSPQESVTVKQDETLTSIAKSHNDTMQNVERANSQISNPNLIHPGQKVYLPKTTPDQVVTGVDNSQIKPVITAMAAVNSADQALRDLQHSSMRNAGLLDDARAQSAQSWDTVRQTTLDVLMNNNAGAYPEQEAATEVRQLNALEPGNTKFAAANSAALAGATQSWTQMGVTKPQLSPIIDAYNNAKRTTDSVNQYLQNPHVSHNRAIVDDLHSSEQQVNSRLNAAIEKSLTDAASQAGRDPKARSEAMTQRAANIHWPGRRTRSFRRRSTTPITISK